MRVPKIRIGLDRHGKSKLDYSNTNTTTMPFGLGQPVYGQEIIPGSTVKVHEGAFIRLASMVLPSFCRSLKYITESTFVPYENLIKTYSLMKSEQPYTTSNYQTYYPKETPTADLSVLTTAILVQGSVFTIWQDDSVSGIITDGRVYLERAFAINDSGAEYNTCMSALNSRLLSSSITSIVPLNSNHDRYRDIDSGEAVYPSSADFIIPFEASDEVYIACFRLDNVGRQLRNVLIGCGYKMTLSHSKKSTLPLWAFYKAYYDRNRSHRYDENWESTSVYSYLFQVMEKNITYIKHSDVSQSTADIRLAFWNAFLMLSGTFYYLDPDYFTVQLDNLSNPSSSLALINADSGSLSPETTSTGVSIGNNAQEIFWENGITATAIHQLQALQAYANKSKVIGGLVSEYMYIHGLGDYLEQHGSIPVHTQSYDIKVSDIDVTANSSADGNLSVVGDYAGKGVGSGEGSYEFNAKSAGYFVIIGYIVPTSGFYQGIDPCLDHFDKTSFYEPAFDSLGYQLTSQGELFTNDVISGISANPTDTPFGYLPRFYEYKCKPQNIINGNVSLPSTRDNLMPYTLDRHITDRIVKETKNGSNEYEFTITFPVETSFVASPSLRAVGLLPYLDNYNRIFYNSGEQYVESDYSHFGQAIDDDNFIIHHVFDVAAWSPVISPSYSFDTDADDNQSVDVTQE